MMQADNSEKEEHLMCVFCEFENSYLICKIQNIMGGSPGELCEVCDVGEAKEGLENEL